MNGSGKEKPKEAYPARGSAVSDLREIGEIRDILRLLSKTVSTVKIFLHEHATARRMTDELWEKLQAFLEQNQELELGIRETAFTYRDIVVLEDKKITKSLPFLFYKDGMEKLLFRKGITREELQDFLGIIKSVQDLPSEESDIVNLLWERDFLNIQYETAEDFLETKIGKGRKLPDIEVDRNALFTGTIRLLPEDRALLEETARKRPHPEEQEGKQAEEAPEDEDALPALEDRESRILEAMLVANRRIRPEEELILILTEILNMEKDPERFGDILESIQRLNRSLLRDGRIDLAHRLVSSLLEVKMILSSSADPRVSRIHVFLREARKKETRDLLRDCLVRGKEKDVSLLVAYTDLLFGEEALFLLSDLYNTVENRALKNRLLAHIEEKGIRNPQVLMRLAGEEKPALAKEVISILGRIPDKRAVSCLASFISSSLKELRMEAVRALAGFKDETSARILLGFLSDEDEEVRITAARSIPAVKEKSVVENLGKIVTRAGFRRKSGEEKQAFLDVFSRIKIKESYAVLEKILKKKTFLPSRSLRETRLCAVRALEAMGSPEAGRILSLGAGLRNRRIRGACRRALQSFSSRSDSG